MASCLVNVAGDWQQARHELEAAGCTINKLGAFGDMRGQFVRTLHCRWPRRSAKAVAQALHDLDRAELRAVPRLLRQE